MKAIIEKQKNKGGRSKIVFTDEQTAKVEELASYLNCEQIADYFGFSEDTFHELKKRDIRVFRAYKKGRACKIYDYAKKLENKAMGIDEAGDTTAIIFFLKTQGGWSSENKSEGKAKISFGKATPMEIFNSGLRALADSQIDFTQMQQIANLAVTKMNIEKDNPALEDKELKITVEIKENENIENLKKFRDLKSQIVRK